MAMIGGMTGVLNDVIPYGYQQEIEIHYKD